MHYVVSVPHTGSRTLIELLHPEQSWERHVMEGHLLHFGLDDARIESVLRDEPVHIPIRNPIDTLASWHSRRLSCDRCVLRCMAKLVEFDPSRATYYVVEPLSKRVRTGRERIPESSEVAREAWERLKTPQIEAFYEQFYGKI